MKHLGDFDTSAVIYGKFTTYRPSTGATFTLGGTPALSVYKDNSTTQSTTGVTLTVDFDTVTGLNHFTIDTSADGTFYSSGSYFDIVITTGTVDSVSVTGSVVGSFTLRKNSSLKPTTAGRTLDVSATGEAGLDWANIGSPTTSVNLSGTSTKALEPTTAGRTLDVTAGGNAGIDFDNITLTNGADAVGILASGTLNGTHSATTADLGANAPAKDISGMTLRIPTHGVSRVVTSYNTVTGIATFDSTAETLANGDQWYVDETPPNASSGTVNAAVTSIANNAITAASIAANAFNGKGDWNIGKTGYSLSSAGISAIWQDTTAGDFTVVGSIGKSIMNGVALGTGLTVNDITTKTGFSLANGAITAAVIATGAVDADALASDAVNEIADGILDRNMATGTDSGTDSTVTRTPRQALRALRNKVTIAAGTATVTKEDDTTASWTSAISTAAGNPISGSDPT